MAAGIMVREEANGDGQPTFLVGFVDSADEGDRERSAEVKIVRPRLCRLPRRSVE